MGHHFEVGEYTARIVAQGFTESKEKKTPGFFLEVEFLSATGPNSLPDNPQNRTISWWITDNTIDFVIEKLRLLGWDGAKLTDLEPGADNHHSFVGQEIQVYCQHDGEYDKFDLSHKFGVEEVAGLASKLDKLFGKQVMATAKKSPRKKPASRKSAEADAELTSATASAEVNMPQSDNDDEIPF